MGSLWGEVTLMYYFERVRVFTLVNGMDEVDFSNSLMDAKFQNK